MSDKKDDTDSTPRSNSLQNEETLEKTVPTDHEQGDTAALPRAITGWKWFLFICSTLTSIFLYALDNTIVANIQPAIVNRFNAVDQLPWLSVGFMVGGVALVMPLGKLYALYDAKWIFNIGFVIFIAASALCGGAPTIEAEIVGRVFAGAGGNAMYLGLLHLISVNTTDQERPAYLSLTGMVWGLGTVLGPVIGGAFELYTWRWAFYINLCFAVPLVPAYLFLIPSYDPTNGAGRTILERARSIDWVGAFLSIAAFVLVIVPINFGGTLFEWNSGTIIALFVVSGLLWIAFAIQQTLCILTTEKDRMFPVHLLKNKEVVLLFIIGCCVGTVSYVTVYYIPLYFQFTRGDTAIQTAERMLPFIIFLIALMLSSGYLMGKLGYYKPWYVVGSGLALAGSALYSTLGVNSSNGENYGYQVLIGIGAGAYTQANFAVVQAVLPAADAGNGVTLMLISQLVGLCFGLSVAGALFINIAENGLAAALPNIPHEQVVSIVAGTSGGILQTLSTMDRAAALNAVVDAENKVFTQIYVAAAVSFVLSLFLSNRKAFLPASAMGG